MSGNHKKQLFLAAMTFAFLAGAVFIDGQTQIKNGEATIYFRNGHRIIDKVVDISNTRLVLETEGHGELPLRDIWMINFDHDGWNFPAERKRVATRDHTIILRNKSVSAGRIVDFSSDRRVFQFEGGEEFPIGQIRRIYFDKNVPSLLASAAKKAAKKKAAEEPVSDNVWVGTFIRPGSLLGVSPLEIVLREDGTAQMTIDRGGAQELGLNGRWEQIDVGSIRVTVTNQVNSADTRVTIFGLEKDTLISLSGALGSNVRLARR
jgi:hypothetical protein